MALDPLDSKGFVQEVATRFHLRGPLFEDREREPRPAGKLKGADVLKGGNVDVILERLYDDDPLEVCVHARRFLREKGIILDLERVVHTTLAYLAFEAARDRYDGHPPLQMYIERAIEQSIRTITEEDRSSQMHGTPMDPLLDPYMRVGFGPEIDPAQVRNAVMNFNAMREGVRVACFRVLVEGKSFEEALVDSDMSTAELEGHLAGILHVMASAPPRHEEQETIDNLLDRILANCKKRRDEE